MRSHEAGIPKFVKPEVVTALGSSLALGSRMSMDGDARARSLAPSRRPSGAPEDDMLDLGWRP